MTQKGSKFEGRSQPGNGSKSQLFGAYIYIQYIYIYIIYTVFTHVNVDRYGYIGDRFKTLVSELKRPGFDEGQPKWALWQVPAKTPSQTSRLRAESGVNPKA